MSLSPNGSAYADLDNDGDLDLVVNNINEEAFVYRNNSEKLNDANFLRVDLINSKNEPVFGSRITLYTGDEIQTNETTNVREFILRVSLPLVWCWCGRAN